MIKIELLTKEDLENFRNELKKDLEKLILEKDFDHSHKLLRTSEVIKLLKISKVHCITFVKKVLFLIQKWAGL